MNYRLFCSFTANNRQ
ncbi:unnamed protein product [Callosobruchus maculatus]|uniref:Uncharacterized protein n=1 Tax=Callosobruchus maculatus TaxID=64391 RepID=A0A653DWX4_CALMS|nr:unnamed protein product [Callosobruchus maculatus]